MRLGGPHRSRPCPAHKVGKLTAQQEETLLHQAWCGRLEAASGSSTPCARSGRVCPRKQRQDPVLLASYGDRLRRLGADAEAADLWLEALRKDPPRAVRPPAQAQTGRLPAHADPAQEDPGSAWRRAAGRVRLLAGQLDDAQRLLGRKWRRRRMPPSTTPSAR